MNLVPLPYSVADITLAKQGESEVYLARKDMPALTTLVESYYAGKKPLRGASIAGSLHLTAQTAVLIESLIALGAKVRFASCNIFSTQDSVVAYLASKHIPVFGYKGETAEDYYNFLIQSLCWGDQYPNLILDDGGDLLHLVLGGKVYQGSGNWDWDKDNELSSVARAKIKSILSEKATWFSQTHDSIVGVSEETTTGVTRLRKWLSHSTLAFPVMDVNNSATKSKFDNLYGSRESLVDGLRRALGIMLAGKTALVCGFGDVGKGCAESLASLGCRVIVTEIDPICALQAAMEGYQVSTIEASLPSTDIVVCATGCVGIIRKEHIPLIKHGGVLCNMGHFDCEIDMSEISTLPRKELAPQVSEYQYLDKSFIVLAEGRLVNLGCAKGHPSFVMSCSFTNQAIALIELFNNRSTYSPGIHRIPKILDELVAHLHLPSLNATLTKLTPQQANYLGIPIEGPFKDNDYRY
ncbi:MAG: adenosylhomocysteinase [Methylacidiphilales bacterium]|nr:adenosylhomocysteinase [Candidatus Methylacidiphilales bacterium]